MAVHWDNAHLARCGTAGSETVCATASRVLLYYSHKCTMHAAEEQIEKERHDRWVVSDDVYVPHNDPDPRLACACPYAETITGNTSVEARYA